MNIAVALLCAREIMAVSYYRKISLSGRDIFQFKYVSRK